jgi:uncharacterized DUF497 family protein
VKVDISERVLDKLKRKHNVTYDEVQQCFENRSGGFLEDPREVHRTIPPTQWFIAETNQRRKLKVVFIQRQPRGVVRIDIRTAFEPNEEETHIYKKYGR